MWDRVREALFPAACAGCRRAGTALCAACAPAAHASRRFSTLGLTVAAAGEYDGGLRAAILALKHGERAPLDALAPLLAALVGSGDAALVPVRTTWWRANRRGFDQAVALARRAAALAGAPYADVLCRRGFAQRGGDRAARLAAVGRYAVRPGAGLPARALLVDDVCTTGATLRDAAAALRAAGVAVDGALVLARTPPGRNPRDRGAG